MSEEVMVNRAYFNGLQRNICHMIHQFCNRKESLDDTDIKALEDMIKVYKTTGFDWVKKWVSNRESFLEEGVGVVPKQGSVDIRNLADK